MLIVEVQALVRPSSRTCHEKVQNILKRLRSEYGPKLPVLLLSLDVIRAGSGPDLNCEAFTLQLQEIIHSVHLIDTNHRLVLYYIEQLNNRSSVHASSCVKTYILHRLIPEEKFEWCEQAIINYIAMVTDVGIASSTVILQNLEQDLTLFADAMKCELHPGAAQAAHALI